MSQEKQIEEMSTLIYENRPIKDIWNEDADSIAETLYNAGYRKQSEDVVEVVRCEKCRHWENGVCYNEAQKYLFTDAKHYCSYGAKMKGGAE